MSLRTGSDIRLDITILRDGAAPGLDPLVSFDLYYLDPDGVEGHWTGVVDDGALGTGHYVLARASNIVPGTFSVWYEALFQGGGKVVGDPEPLSILERGE